MAERMVEKATCENCGVDIRDNTQFCYNCGKGYAEPIHDSIATEPIPMPDNAKDALDDLARKLDADNANIDQLAKAAAERKKARVTPRKPKETVWEDGSERGHGLFFLSTLLICVIVAAIVFLTVYWR